MAWPSVASLGLFWPVSKANGAYRHQRRGVTQNAEGDNDKGLACLLAQPRPIWLVRKGV